MEHEVEASGGEPSVADLQDLYLNSESQGAIARDRLSEMVDVQRRQAEAVVTVISQLREGLRTSEGARLSLEEENRRLAIRLVDLERQLKLIHSNYSRLTESYSTMMRFVEDTHTSSVGLNHRIDAMLLQNELGMSRDSSPAPARRVTEFRDGVFSHPAVRQHHPEVRHPEMHLGSYYQPAPHHESEFTTYGHDTYAPRPMPAHRNER
ncbi:hypothetical protein HFN89_04630 [Rhizobium laguerreae]|nr:hypothetical protein [Rhizobium laguerreae]